MIRNVTNKERHHELFDYTMEKPYNCFVRSFDILKLSVPLGGEE